MPTVFSILDSISDATATESCVTDIAECALLGVSSGLVETSHVSKLHAITTKYVIVGLDATLLKILVRIPASTLDDIKLSVSLLCGADNNYSIEWAEWLLSVLKGPMLEKLIVNSESWDLIVAYLMLVGNNYKSAEKRFMLLHFTNACLAILMNKAFENHGMSKKRKRESGNHGELPFINCVLNKDNNGLMQFSSVNADARLQLMGEIQKILRCIAPSIQPNLEESQLLLHEALKLAFRGLFGDSYGSGSLVDRVRKMLIVNAS